MSLLNEVLRDIDQRRRETSNDAILTSVLVAREPDIIQWQYPLLVGLVVIVCGSLTYWFVNSNPFDAALHSTFEIPMRSNQLNIDHFSSAGPGLQHSIALTAFPLQWTEYRVAAPVSVVDQSNSVSQMNSGVPAPLKVAQTPLEVEPQVTVTSLRSPARLVSEAPEPRTLPALVDQVLAGLISKQEFRVLMNEYIGETEATVIERQMARFDYTLQSVDDLMTLLSVNKRLHAFGMDRTQAQNAIFGQLRIKSTEPGYWAFHQAVLFDKANEPRQAFYYYNQAISTDHITSKQRQLSRMRMEQIQGSVRNE